MIMNIKITIPSLLALFCFLNLPLYGREQEAPGDHALTIIEELKKSGIQKIGSFDLEAFRNQVKTVQWSFNASAPPDDIAGGFRRSAYYIRAKKKVVITSTGTPQSEAAINLLELHEALGVLGYQEDTYAQSGALSLLNKVSQNPSLRNQLIKSYGETVFRKDNLLAKEGGGSSVGGGGDSDALMLKDKVITEILASNIALDSDFYLQYPLIRFEPLEYPGLQALYLNYEYEPSPDGSVPRLKPNQKYEELFTILFPALMWRKTELQEKIVRETRKMLEAVFPIYLNAESEEGTPLDCSADVKVQFKKTDDRDMQLIQKVRSGLITGCNMKTNQMSVSSWPRWIK